MGNVTRSYKTGSVPPSNLPGSCSLSRKSHESPREGASPSFHQVPLISALNRANQAEQCSLPQGWLLSSAFPVREETQCPEEMERHIPHREPGKSCLSAWSGCNFAVIYSSYSFNLNYNWMLQAAQPVLLRLQHPHRVRPVCKSSELNIFIFMPCFFSLEFKHWQFIIIPKPGEEPAFCQHREAPAHSFSPQNGLVSKHQPDSERGREQLVGAGNEYPEYAQEQTAGESAQICPTLTSQPVPAGEHRGAAFKELEKLKGHAELSACSPNGVIWQYQQRSENIRAMLSLSRGFLCCRQEIHSSAQPCQSKSSSDTLT